MATDATAGGETIEDKADTQVNFEEVIRELQADTNRQVERIQQSKRRDRSRSPPFMGGRKNWSGGARADAAANHEQRSRSRSRLASRGRRLLSEDYEDEEDFVEEEEPLVNRGPGP